MTNLFKRLLQNESGATAIEYALIAALISVAAITVMTKVGTSIKGTFTTVSTQLDNAASGK